MTYTQYWAANTNVPLPGQPVLDSQIQAQIVAGFTSGKLTYDPSTLYLVFTDALTGSPNNDPAADAEVNTLAHGTLGLTAPYGPGIVRGCHRPGTRGRLRE